MTALRRSRPSSPGWSRGRWGRGFVYRDQNGAVLRGEDRRRCEQLAIPPAWTDVWICPWPDGHIQAIGTDQAGRRQYLYHPDWRTRRDRAKYARMLRFGQALPAARERVSADLDRDGMPRERALAVAFRLMDLTGLRTGGESYARERGTVGVATLRREHVRVRGDRVRLRFVGKSGREHDLRVTDGQLAAGLRVLLARRGEGELLAYREQDQWHDVKSSDVNAYVREVLGIQATAKDFRTWQAAVAALRSLADSAGEDTRRRAVAEAMRAVSQHLGNTPAVARTSYVDPRIVHRFETGKPLPDPAGDDGFAGDPTELTVWEAPLLALLGA